MQAEGRAGQTWMNAEISWIAEGPLLTTVFPAQFQMS